MIHCTHPSPVGDLHLCAHVGRLVRLGFKPPTEPGVVEEPLAAQTRVGMQPSRKVLNAAREQLDAYFAGQRKRFELPIALSGTPFQLRVWGGLRRIRFAKTLSYRELAEQVGHPGASRAVGSANGANPLAIVIPCHRVIASDGSLAGFAGGVDVKRALLDHERAGAGLFALAMG